MRLTLTLALVAAIGFAFSQVAIADEQDAQNIENCKAAVIASDYQGTSKYCRAAVESWSKLADISHGNDRAEDLLIEGTTLFQLALADGAIGDNTQMVNDLRMAHFVLEQVIREGHNKQAMHDAQATLNRMYSTIENLPSH